ncbi:hypothetical protein F4560_006443 [Saccharothrix ecbatanensis]|uniref:Uncharacterized protein n=1 Tax=Saccharothrix ecbatanensis TaxID=1105145 RepID=A0A7W9HQZ7_9PSEU|nr:hypothetical protein [Saccharothrix ecbatanensis]MBB5806675.1 hypothetical protein [Saccharothrix ecbatanensis]
MGTLLGLVGLLFWWKWRSERKAERSHAEALVAFAGTLGGRVVGPAEAHAWSAELLPPMKSDTEGVIGWMGTVRRPRFETALDFRRGNWSVRVSEASMEKANSTSSATIYEHRIEVATSIVAPMKISRRLLVDHMRRPLPPKRIPDPDREPAAEAPVTVVREQRPWLRTRVPAPVDGDFVVFTTDPSTVARAFNPQFVEWMLGQAGDDPFESAWPLHLTFEAGLVFATSHRRIDPDKVLAKVDVILGMLDRMPHVTPAHPPVSA